VTDLKRCWLIVPFVDHGGVTCDGSEGGNMSQYIILSLDWSTFLFFRNRVHSGVCV
jgi:hypothetical protein